MSLAPFPPEILTSLDRLVELAPSRPLQDLIRAACHTVALDDGVAVTRVLARLMMFVKQADRAHAIHLMMNGFWEFELTRAIARSCRPGTMAIDCGANYGYFSLVMAHFVGSAGTMVAIEANADIAALLRDSLRVNGFLSRSNVIQKAAWSEAGLPMAFMTPDSHPMNGKLQILNRRPERVDSHAVMNVQTFVLDDLLARNSSVSVLKIDVEGAEVDVLEGAQRLIIANPGVNIFLEVNPARYDDPSRLVRLIRQLGLSVRRLHSSGEHPSVDLDAFEGTRESKPAMWWLTRAT